MLDERDRRILEAARRFAMGDAKEEYTVEAIQRHARNVGNIALAVDDPAEKQLLHALFMRLERIMTEGTEPFSAARIKRDFYPLGRFCIEILKFDRQQIGEMICPDGCDWQQAACARMMEFVIKHPGRFP